MRALDLFCGAGGAALGMIDAGFKVVGVDIRKATVYPGEFIQADVRDLPVDAADFDFVWASPPCQRFSMQTAAHCRERHPDMIDLTRGILSGHPFSVIENVPRAPIRPDIYLLGPSNGLPRIERKRIFELSFQMMQPPQWKQPSSMWRAGKMLTICGDFGASSHWYDRRKAGLPGRPSIEEAREVMGFPRDYPIKTKELSESVPPPYAKLIAYQAMLKIKERTING